MPFPKGHVPWNKGSTVRLNTGRTHFKKGQNPWNKGKKGLQTQSQERRKWRSEYAKSHGYGKWLKDREPYNKGKRGLYRWSAETRKKYNLAIQDPDVQEKFRKHGVRTMQTMIKAETSIEMILGSLLTDLQLEYDKQANVEDITLADCFLKQFRLVIYADGTYWHNFPNGTERDKRITKELENRNYVVLRFWEDDLIDRPQYVKDVIRDTVETIRGVSEKTKI